MTPVNHAAAGAAPRELPNEPPAQFPDVLRDAHEEPASELDEG